MMFQAEARKKNSALLIEKKNLENPKEIMKRKENKENYLITFFQNHHQFISLHQLHKQKQMLPFSRRHMYLKANKGR